MSLDNMIMPAIVESSAEGKVTVNERELVVPPELHIIGVQNDNDVENIFIEVPRYFDEVNDLDEFEIRVNWVNALNQADSSPTTKVSSTESIITVKWTVPKGLCIKEGSVEVSVAASHVDGRAWHTTTTKLEVLKGILLSDQIEKEYPDVINELLTRVKYLEDNPGGGDKEIFIAEYEVTPFAEIKKAYKEGKQINLLVGDMMIPTTCIFDDELIMLVGVNGTVYSFIRAGIFADNTWSSFGTPIITGYNMAKYDETFTEPVSLDPVTQMLKVKKQSGGGSGEKSWKKETITLEAPVDSFEKILDKGTAELWYRVKTFQDVQFKTGFIMPINEPESFWQERTFNTNESNWRYVHFAPNYLMMYCIFDNKQVYFSGPYYDKKTNDLIMRVRPESGNLPMGSEIEIFFR